MSHINYIIVSIIIDNLYLDLIQEKKTLLRQVGTIEKLRQEAEKEADQAINQLEGFVREQEKVVRN